MSFIQKARSMPANDRIKIALIVSAALTALIVGVWLLALKGRADDEAIRERSTAESLKPLFMIFRGAKEDIKEIKADAKTYRSDDKGIPQPVQ